MKKTYLFLLAAAALVCSCAKELANESSESAGKTVVCVGIDGSVKTSLGVKDGSAYPVLWSEGDALAIDGVLSAPLAASCDGKASAQFTFDGILTEPYNLLYCGKAGSPDVVVFPKKQSYVGATFAPFTAPMYGVGEGGSVTMKHLNSVIRISLTGAETDTLSKIVIVTKDGKPISGEFTANKVSDKYDGTLTAPEKGSDVVIVDLAGETVLGSEAQDFFAVIPAGTYTGFKIYVVNKDKKAMLLSTSLATALAGKVYELPVKTFAADANTFVIAEPSDMDVLTTLVSTTGVGKTALIVDDIDMSGRSWTSFGSGGTVTNPGNFSGTLDGLGHTISGLTTSLLGNLGGIVKNLTIEANIDFNGNNTYYKGSTYGYGILAGYATNVSPYNHGTCVENVTTKGSITISCEVNNNVNFGGILGCNNGGSILNCTNEATLTFKKSCNGPLTMGGVVGTSQTSSSVVPAVVGCINRGKLIASGGSKASNVYIGGVMGNWANDKNTTFSGFENYGDIEINTGFAYSYSGIGGVIGHVKPTSTFNNFKNEGNMTFNTQIKSTGTSYARIGGVIGHVEATASFKANGFVNNGDLVFNSGKGCSTVLPGGLFGNIKSTTVAIATSVNNGDVIFNGSVSSNDGQILQMGGIAARIETNGNTATSVTVTGETGKATNTGKIALYDDTDLTYNPVAGGIVGCVVGNTNGGTVTLNMSNCSNEGVIDRKVSNYTADGNYSASNHQHRAGGVIGYISSSVKCTVQNCSNSADIRFDKNNGSATPLSTASQEAGFCGGIVGNSSNTTGDGPAMFKNCHNSGNITCIEGYCGGIGGYIWNATVTGEQGNYCTNTGNVVYRGNPAIRPQTTAGGIIGGGSTAVTLKWCYNTGSTAGNGSAAGLVGKVNNLNALMTIQNCKSFCFNCCTSTWAKAGLLCGYTSKQEDPAVLLTNVSHVAVGGTICYGISNISDAITPNPENYVNYLYYNKVTAPEAAQTSGAATAVLTPEQASGTYDITLWDGITPLAWE